MRNAGIFRLVAAISIGSMLLVFGYKRIQANDERGTAKSAEPVQKDERREYLEKLWEETEMAAREELAFGRFDDAIDTTEDNMKKLDKTDYDEYPGLVARFCAFASEAYFLAAGSEKVKGEKISDSKRAVRYMQHAIEWRNKAVRLYEEDDDVELFEIVLNLVSLGMDYFIVEDLKAAEDTFQKAITIAEAAPSEDCDRTEMLFHAKKNLMIFYSETGRTNEAERIAEELELMIESGQISGATKEGIRTLLEAARRSDQ